MLRILWIVSLLVAVGAEEHDPLKFNVKRYFDALNRDINIALRNTFGVLAQASTDSSYTASSTTDPTNRCATTASSTAHPASQPTMGTTGDCDTDNSSAEPPVKGNLSQAGSIKGVAGVNFPDYVDIPLTSFSCSDKNFIPGFYADMETRCQVFHVCWPHRRESFLCPVGTTFNQALLTCDYWYSSNCSLAPHYYNVNEYSTQADKLGSPKNVNMGSMIDVLLGTGQVDPTKQSKDSEKDSSMNADTVLSFISNFLPVKAKVTVYPETEENRLKVVATASVGKTTQREKHDVKYVHKTSENSKKYYPTSKTTSPSQSRYSSQSPESSTKMSYPTSESTSPSESQYSTQSPETSTQKYAKVEETVKVILDEVFETVQNILREVRGIVAMQRSKAPVHGKRPPLPTLNPRFKTKPIMPPSVSSTTGKMGVSSSTKSPVAGIPKMSTLPKTHVHVKHSVLSMTKEALVANYLRLLKIRKA